MASMGKSVQEGLSNVLYLMLVMAHLFKTVPLTRFDQQLDLLPTHGRECVETVHQSFRSTKRASLGRNEGVCIDQVLREEV